MTYLTGSLTSLLRVASLSFSALISFAISTATLPGWAERERERERESRERAEKAERDNRQIRGQTIECMN